MGEQSVLNLVASDLVLCRRSPFASWESVLLRFLRRHVICSSRAVSRSGWLLCKNETVMRASKLTNLGSCGDAVGVFLVFRCVLRTTREFDGIHNPWPVRLSDRTQKSLRDLASSNDKINPCDKTLLGSALFRFPSGLADENILLVVFDAVRILLVFVVSVGLAR